MHCSQGTQDLNRDRMADYLELSGDWFFELDQDYAISFCHIDAEDRETESGKLIGRSYLELVPRDYRDYMQDLLDARRRDQLGGRFHSNLIDDMGNHWEVKGLAVFDGGRFLGFRLLAKNLSRNPASLPEPGDAPFPTFAPELPEGVELDQTTLLQPLYQELLVSLCLHFANTADFHDMVKQALQMVGYILGVDRIYICQDKPEDMSFEYLYEWCAPDIPSLLRTVKRTPYRERWDVYNQLLTLPFVSAGDTVDLPESGWLSEPDTRSLIYMPLQINGGFWGYLGVDYCRTSHAWKLSEINLLQTIVGLMTTTFQKHFVEEYLKDTLFKLESVVTHFPGIIWSVSPDHVLTFCEGNALDLLGEVRGTLAGSPLESLRQWELLDRFVARVEQCFNEGPQSFQAQIGERFFNCNTDLLTGPDGEIIGQMGVALDVTEDRRMREKLEQAIRDAEAASKAKSEFLSRMSHEIRTPMNAIIGMNSIARKTDELEKIRYCLDRVESASHQLLNIINDILDISKIEADKFEIHLHEFDFEKMLQNVYNVINVRMEEKKQKFTLDFDDVFFCKMISDELRLNQVITNLLTNASKFTPEGGEIILRIRSEVREDDMTRLNIAVVDNGIGISRENQAQLFSSFVQADGSITRQYGGSGLGLAICKRIVTLMGGEIWVESEEGKGATFCFYVDVKWGNEQTERAAGGKLNRYNLRLLAVDDNDDVQMYFRNTMNHFALRCDVAAGGMAAVSMARKALGEGDPYTIAFVDWEMPRENGIEIARQLLELDSRLSIIMISVADWGDIEPQAAPLGIIRYLQKPLRSAAVYEMITEIVQGGNAAPAVGPVAVESLHWDEQCILLAEDVAINREILISLLSETGVVVECVENGLEAVERFQEDPARYDLILMDIQMPVMDGLQATRLIRQESHFRAESIPILAMTANAFQEDVERCLEAGMNGHVAKPIDFEDLLGKLSQFLSPSL